MRGNPDNNIYICMSDLMVLYTMLVSNYFVHNIHHHMLVFCLDILFLFSSVVFFLSVVRCGFALL
jgi:hypothetical protein